MSKSVAVVMALTMFAFGVLAESLWVRMPAQSIHSVAHVSISTTVDSKETTVTLISPNGNRHTLWVAGRIEMLPRNACMGDGCVERREMDVLTPQMETAKVRTVTPY